MVFRTLVSTIIQYQNDPDNVILANSVNALKKEISYDLRQAFAMGDPLLRANPTLFRQCPSYLSFLLKICDALPATREMSERSEFCDNDRPFRKSEYREAISKRDTCEEELENCRLRLNTAIQEKEAYEKQLNDSRSRLDAAIQEKEAYEKQLNDSRSRLDAVPNGRIDARPDTEENALQKQLNDAFAKMEELQITLTKANSEKEDCQKTLNYTMMEKEDCLKSQGILVSEIQNYQRKINDMDLKIGNYRKNKKDIIRDKNDCQTILSNAATTLENYQRSLNELVKENNILETNLNTAITHLNDCQKKLENYCERLNKKFKEPVSLLESEDESDSLLGTIENIEVPFLRTEVDKFENKYYTLKDEFEKCKHDLYVCDMDRDDLLGKETKFVDQMHTLTNENDLLRNQVWNLKKSKVATNGENLENYKLELERYKENNKDLQSQLNKSENSIQSLKDELKKLKDSKVEVKNEDSDNCRRQVKRLENSIKDLNCKLKESQGTIQSLKDCQKKLDESEARNTDLQSQLGNSKRSIEWLEGKLQKSKDFKVEVKNEDLEDCMQKLRISEAKIADLEGKIKNSNIFIRSLEIELRKSSDPLFMESIQMDLYDFEERNRNLLGDLRDYIRKFIVCDKENQKLNLQLEECQKDNESLTNQISELKKTYESKIKSELYSLDAKHKSLECKNNELEQENESLKKQLAILRPNKQVYKIDEPEIVVKLETDEELKKCEKEELKKENESLKKENVNLKNENENLKRELQECEDKNKKFEKENGKLSNENESLKIQLDTLEQNQMDSPDGTLKMEIDDDLNECEDEKLEQKNKRLKINLKKYEDKNEKLEEDNSSLLNENELLKAQLGKCLKENERLENELTESENKYKKIEGKKSLKHKLKNLQQNLSYDVIDEVGGGNDALKIELENCKEKLRELQKENDANKIKLEESEANAESIQRQSDEWEQKVGNLSQKNIELNRECNNVKTELKLLEAEEEKWKSAYDVTLKELETCTTELKELHEETDEKMAKLLEAEDQILDYDKTETDLCQKIRHMRQAYDKIALELKRLHAEEGNWKSEYDVKLKELEACRTELQELHEKTDEKMAKLFEAEDEILEYDKTEIDLCQKIRRMRQAHDQIALKLKHLKAEEGKWKSEYDVKVEELESCRTKLQNLDGENNANIVLLEKSNANAEFIQSELDTCKNEKEALKLAYNRTLEDLQKCTSSYDTLKAKHKLLKKEIESLEQDLSVCRSDLSDCRNSRTNFLTDLINCQSDLEYYRNQSEVFRKEYRECERKKGNLEKEIRNFQKRGGDRDKDESDQLLKIPYIEHEAEMERLRVEYTEMERNKNQEIKSLKTENGVLQLGVDALKAKYKNSFSREEVQEREAKLRKRLEIQLSNDSPMQIDEVNTELVKVDEQLEKFKSYFHIIDLDRDNFYQQIIDHIESPPFKELHDYSKTRYPNFKDDDWIRMDESVRKILEDFKLNSLEDVHKKLKDGSEKLEELLNMVGSENLNDLQENLFSIMDELNATSLQTFRDNFSTWLKNTETLKQLTQANNLEAFMKELYEMMNATESKSWQDFRNSVFNLMKEKASIGNTLMNLAQYYDISVEDPKWIDELVNKIEKFLLDFGNMLMVEKMSDIEPAIMELIQKKKKRKTGKTKQDLYKQKKMNVAELHSKKTKQDLKIMNQKSKERKKELMLLKMEMRKLADAFNFKMLDFKRFANSFEMHLKELVKSEDKLKSKDVFSGNDKKELEKWNLLYQQWLSILGLREETEKEKFADYISKYYVFPKYTGLRVKRPRVEYEYIGYRTTSNEELKDLFYMMYHSYFKLKLDFAVDNPPEQMIEEKLEILNAMKLNADRPSELLDITLKYVKFDLKTILGKELKYKVTEEVPETENKFLRTCMDHTIKYLKDGLEAIKSNQGDQIIEEWRYNKEHLFLMQQPKRKKPRLDRPQWMKEDIMPEIHVSHIFETPAGFGVQNPNKNTQFGLDENEYVKDKNWNEIYEEDVNMEIAEINPKLTNSKIPLNNDRILFRLDDEGNEYYERDLLTNKLVYPHNSVGDICYARDKDGHERIFFENGIPVYGKDKKGKEIYPKLANGDEFYLETQAREFAARDENGKIYYARTRNGNMFYPKWKLWKGIVGLNYNGLFTDK